MEKEIQKEEEFTYRGERLYLENPQSFEVSYCDDINKDIQIKSELTVSQQWVSADTSITLLDHTQIDGGSQSEHQCDGQQSSVSQT